MKLDPNAPAFPRNVDFKDSFGNRYVEAMPGIHIRAHLAAMAMQGLLSRAEYTNLADAAEDAVRCADYLIDALDAKEET